MAPVWRFDTLITAVTACLCLSQAQAASLVGRQDSTSCKAIPGDDQWPGQVKWNQLNETVGGRLIATEPQAAVCHPNGYGSVQYNATTCTALQAVWDKPAIHEPFAGEIMNQYYANASCSPFYNINGTCELGNLVSYSISVTSAEDIVAGLNFSRENNVRLVIKNTGHDFAGKSTAKGGLALWTHNLRGMEFIDSYNSTSYIGAAVKISSGHTGAELLEFANQRGYRAVTGDCPTVGVAGGYATGGGHGYLNSKHGMGADQILEVEVVTADGQHLIATPTQHKDLFWAIAGGGAGTYGVTLSLTYKVYPDEDGIGAATLSFNNTAAPSQEAYLEAVAAFWQWLPSLVDTGATAAFNVIPGQFLIYNTTAPGQTAEDLDAVYESYLSQLRDLSVPYTYQSYTALTYYEHYNNTNGPLPDGGYTASPLFNSRIIPRAVSESPERSVNVSQVMIDATELDPEGANWQYGCMGLNVNSTEFFQHADNGLVPYWRDAIAICLQYSLYDWTISQEEMLERKSTLASIINPPIVEATPESGAYLNEADPLVYPQDDPEKWQSTLYGIDHYANLRQIKDKWDPESLFYANIAVGSEDWQEDSEGRLCKA